MDENRYLTNDKKTCSMLGNDVSYGNIETKTKMEVADVADNV